ncbi:MAG: hemolysin III family protein [Acidimicrobiales bacterium]
MTSLEPAEGLAARPLLRGWLHLVCFFLAVPAAITVVLLASTPRARVGAAVYAVGLVALFGVSGIYHRGPWKAVWRRRLSNLDHMTIFAMIAGSYTPLCLLVLDGWVAALMFIVAWTGAVLGGVLSWTTSRRSRIVRSALYVSMGWSVLVATPQLVTRLSAGELLLIAAGGVLYTIGAIVLATRWPDPSPRVFGYHEVWHTLVVAAVVCHLIAIANVVHAAGPT